MRKHVLVIDDDFANRMLPGLFLRDMGHEVMECASAEEAFQMIRQHHFTDLLLDISLPNISGLEICRTLRNMPNTADMRIIAYTAHAMPEETKNFSESGFDGLLIKPICQNDLAKFFA
jgi:two-component system, cell cycle response regulator DivK